MSYKHILVAIDTLTDLKELVSFLKSIVDHHHAKLSLSRALQNLTYSGLAYSLPSLLTIEKSLVDSAKLQLQSLRQQMGECEVNEIVEFGRSSDVIVENAKQLDVDLIILGNDKRHFFEATATAVLHHAHCDILAINS